MKICCKLKSYSGGERILLKKAFINSRPLKNWKKTVPGLAVLMFRPKDTSDDMLAIF